MAHNKRRTAKMHELEDKELVQIIADGTLRHAAARHELMARGRQVMIEAVDNELRRQHRG